MATILQQPDTLSLSRNLKKVIISSGTLVSFQLLKGVDILIDEYYYPDVTGRVEIDLSEIVTSSLSISLPAYESGIIEQSNLCAKFSLVIDGTKLGEFTAVRSGVAGFSGNAGTFLKANFLTWQPQQKEVLYDQPEWLSFYAAEESMTVKARFYLKNGTTQEVTIEDSMTPGNIYSLNTQFARLWQLGSGERYGYIDVWTEDADGVQLSYIQRYICRQKQALDEIYLAENSLGGLDTVLMNGAKKHTPEIERENIQLGDTKVTGTIDIANTYSQNTGMLEPDTAKWLFDLLKSEKVYHLVGGTISAIVVDTQSVSVSNMDSLSAFEFTFRISNDKGLLNITRYDYLPEVLEIPGPDNNLFFLTPRLIDFPTANPDSELIIPVQTPFLQQWYHLSIEDLKSAWDIESLVRASHIHGNLSLLEKFSTDSEGLLLFEGKEVGAGALPSLESYAHKNRDNTFTGINSFENGKLLLDGYGLSVNSNGAVSATPPTAGSGSNVLWEDDNDFYSVLNVDGTPKTVALEGHQHTTDDITNLETWISEKGYLTSVTKADIGLGNVENKSASDILAELTKSDITTLLGSDTYDEKGAASVALSAAKKYLDDKIGVANGLATLGSDGLIPSSQLPSYVDDVLEYASLSVFPATGESGKIYVGLTDNKTYRWSGSTYVEISKSLVYFNGSFINIGSDYKINLVVDSQGGLGDPNNNGLGIVSKGVVTAMLDDSAVTTAKIANENVTYAKLASAVTDILDDTFLKSGNNTASGDNTFTGTNSFKNEKLVLNGYKLSINSNGAVSASVPTAGGDFDIAQMWAALTEYDGVSDHIIADDYLPFDIAEYVHGSVYTTGIQALQKQIIAVNASIPTALKSPYALTINDVVYDGSAAKSITGLATQSWVEGKGYTSNKGTVTGVKMNGDTKSPSSGVVDLGTVITAHQSLSAYALKSEIPTSMAWSAITEKPNIVNTIGGYTGAITFGSGVSITSAKVITIANGAVTNAMLAGSIANSKLANSSITINGTAIALGGSVDTPNTWRPVVNNLTSTATDSSLSAAQGKALNDKFGSYLPLDGGTIISSSNNPLGINSTNSIQTYLSIKNSGVIKAAFGWYNNKGAFLYDAAKSYYMGISDTGTPYFQNYTLYHTGNLTAATLGALTDVSVESTGTPLSWNSSRYVAKVHGKNIGVTMPSIADTTTALIGSGNSFIHSGNIGSQSVNYASSAGIATYWKYPSSTSPTSGTTVDFNSPSNTLIYDYGAGITRQNFPSGMIGNNYYGCMLTIGAGGSFTSLSCQLAWNALHEATSRATGKLWFRARANGGWSAAQWKEVALSDTDNNLIVYGNEFNFTPSSFSGSVWINYRTQGDKNGNITEYAFGNGKGSALATISSGQFSGNAASATKLQTARTLWGQSFDGTGNIATTAALTCGTLSAGTTTLGATTVSSLVSSGEISATTALNINGDARIHLNRVGYNYLVIPTGGTLAISTIGTANDAGSVVVIGNGYLSVKGSISATGAITAQGNITAFTSSSRQLKDILHDNPLSYSQRLMKIGRVVDFRYNNILPKGNERHIGLIYEDVLSSGVELYNMCHTSDGYGALNYISPDYINLIAGATQENITEIDRLKAEVRRLQNRINELERRAA